MNQRIANKIMKGLAVERNSVAEIKIGFFIETLLSEIEKLIIMLVICTALGYFGDIIIILGVMLLLRPYIGGTHQNTFLKCLMLTLLFCLVPIYITQYVSVGIHIGIVVTLVLVWILWKYGPITSKYRPKYTEEMLKSIKKKGTFYLLAINAFCVLLDDVIRNEVILVLCMLTIDVVIARRNQVIERRKEEVVDERKDEKTFGKSISR